MRGLVDPSSCCFCAELQHGHGAELSSRYGSALRRVVWLSGETGVLPTIGQLSRGHLLLVTLEHVNSFAALPVAARERAQVRARNLLRTLEGEFGACLAFEHGTEVGATSGACGIVHAHLHIVPVSGAAGFALPFVPKSKWESVDPDRWLADIARLGGRDGYLFVRLPDDSAVAAMQPNVPSQFLRRWAAEAIGSDAWDWRDAGREPALEAMVAWMREQTPPLGFVCSPSSA